MGRRLGSGCSLGGVPLAFHQLEADLVAVEIDGRRHHQCATDLRTAQSTVLVADSTWDKTRPRHAGPCLLADQRGHSGLLRWGGGRLGCITVEACRHHLAQGVQAFAFAGDLEEGVAFQCVGHQVAAQGHDGVFATFLQAGQPDEARAQGVECGQVAAEAGVVEVDGQSGTPVL